MFFLSEDSSRPFTLHTEQGTRSINLLSKIVPDHIPPSSNAQSFKLQVENVRLCLPLNCAPAPCLIHTFYLSQLRIPNETDTTHWCVSTNFSTPVNEKIYIYKVEADSALSMDTRRVSVCCCCCAHLCVSISWIVTFEAGRGEAFMVSKNCMPLLFGALAYFY